MNTLARARRPGMRRDKSRESKIMKAKENRSDWRPQHELLAELAVMRETARPPVRQLLDIVEQWVRGILDREEVLAAIDEFLRTYSCDCVESPVASVIRWLN